MLKITTNQMTRGRQKKIRYIDKAPTITYFSPRGKPGRPEEIELQLDQLEAIRLADYLNHNHIEAAIEMKISRQTFGRILKKARRTIAEAITTGKIIKIRHGEAQIAIKKLNTSPQNNNFT